MSEEAAVRDITHEEFNHRGELMNRLIKSWGGFGRRGASDGLPQVCMGLGVIKLDGFDTAKIIVVTSKLRIARRGRERGLRY